MSMREFLKTLSPQEIKELKSAFAEMNNSRPILRTSWGFPLMPGEKEITKLGGHKILDADGMIWVVNDATFYGKQNIKLQIRDDEDGKIKKQTVYTGSEPFFSQSKPLVEGDVKKTMNQEIILHGYLSRPTTDKKPRHHVYDIDKKPDYNIADRRLVYKSRFNWKDQLLDSALVYFSFYDSSIDRAEYGPQAVANCVAQYTDEHGALIKAIKSALIHQNVIQR